MKTVRQEKRMPLSTWRTFNEKRETLRQQLQDARDAGRKIIYLDEICFTKRSFMGRTWSRKHENVRVDQAQLYQGYRATCATVSEETGVELLATQEMAFKEEHFIPYLQQLKWLNPWPIALFMDQLSVHRGKLVKPWYEKLDIVPIFNVGYSPEFNPIEACFSQVKRVYNRGRLTALANDRTWN
jgi:transposase